MATDRNYVDKQKLMDDICEWQDSVKKAKEDGIEPPIMPDSIGKVIMDIANNLGTRWNFRGYSYVDEMILSGILAGVRAVPLFKREHEKKNPFGFLSFVIWQEFVNVLKKEKKEHSAKMAMFLDENYEGYELGDQDSDMQINKSNMIDAFTN